MCGLERICKEVVAAYFKQLSENLPGASKENHKMSLSRHRSAG
jgi:hypothetical protein